MMPVPHVLPLKRILLAIDVAEPSDAAIAQAHWWAQRFDAALDVLYVVEEDDSADAQKVADAKGEQDLEADLNQLMDRVVPDHGSRCHALVRHGQAAKTIAQIAVSTNADLIVMGSHGRTLVGRWVLGSVAAEVLRDAVLPVLIVKEPAGSLEHATLVVAVDFSDASEAALRYAGRLAAVCGASLYPLHVLPIGEHPSAGHAIMREAACKALRDLVERHVPSTVASRVHVEMGMATAANAIAHHAAAERASLIVMGGHGGSGWTAGVLGSVTNRVIHDTTLPVLVLRPPTSAPS